MTRNDKWLIGFAGFLATILAVMLWQTVSIMTTLPAGHPQIPFLSGLIFIAFLGSLVFRGIGVILFLTIGALSHHYPMVLL